MNTTKKTTKARVVYLAYTTGGRFNFRPELMKVYAKSSYQTAYNWLADIAERHGSKVTPGDGNRAAQTHNQNATQIWWLERHEVA